ACGGPRHREGEHGGAELGPERRDDPRPQRARNVLRGHMADTIAVRTTRDRRPVRFSGYRHGAVLVAPSACALLSTLHRRPSSVTTGDAPRAVPATPVQTTVHLTRIQPHRDRTTQHPP